MNDRFVSVPGAVLIALLVIFSSSIALSAGEDSDGDEGRMLYREKCGNCHGQKGEGFRLVYPPIRNSRYLTEQLPQLPCIIRNGLRGKITVGNKIFNQAMPGDPRITAEEIALITGFMLKEWGHEPLIFEVDAWLKSCTGLSEKERNQ